MPGNTILMSWLPEPPGLESAGDGPYALFAYSRVHAEQLQIAGGPQKAIKPPGATKARESPLPWGGGREQNKYF